MQSILNTLQSIDVHIMAILMIKEILSSDAWVALNSDDASVLIDVRSEIEHEQDGLPYLENKQKLYRILWDLHSEDTTHKFINELKKAGIDNTKRIFFLCKSGGRSYHAAATAAVNGYNAISVADGFLGRTRVGPGWLSSGLPYIYYI